MPIVLKADGLALGKGVLICSTREEAKEGVKTLMLDKQFGSAGDRIVVEEFMTCLLYTSDFDHYLTSHHNQCFPRQTIDRLLRCIENSRKGKWHPYQYPYPPYAKGKIGRAHV